MARRHNSVDGYKQLLEKADILLGKKKIPLKYCKGCGKNRSTFKGFCEECRQKKSLENKNGKIWLSTNGRMFCYNEEGKPQLYDRWLMEKALGRKLLRTEQILHKDGDATNCDPSNLQLKSDLAIDLESLVCSKCRQSLSMNS